MVGPVELEELVVTPIPPFLFFEKYREQDHFNYLYQNQKTVLPFISPQTSMHKIHKKEHPGFFVVPTVLLFMLMAFACTSNTPKNDPRFHGMWKLDIFESYDSIAGTWSRWETPKYHDGYILYDGKGHMAVHLSPKGYQDFDLSENVDSLDKEGLMKRLRFYETNYVYFADYETKDGFINHHRLSATDPKNWGTVLTRDFEFKNDTLILSAREIIDGNRLRLRWVKY